MTAELTPRETLLAISAELSALTLENYELIERAKVIHNRMQELIDLRYKLAPRVVTQTAVVDAS